MSNNTTTSIEPTYAIEDHHDHCCNLIYDNHQGDIIHSNQNDLDINIDDTSTICYSNNDYVGLVSSLRCEEEESIMQWAPWYRKESYEQSMDGLSQEILDFEAWVSPTVEEKAMRVAVLERISSCVNELWPSGTTVKVIGSYETNLLLPLSDMDVVIYGVAEKSTDLKPLFELSHLFNLRMIANSEVITTAKVPIIKMDDFISRTRVDIAFEVQSGQENTKIIQTYLDQFKYLKPLTLVIKFYLKQHYLNDTWTGGVGSYTLIIMIISYLQMNSSTDKTLADLLIGFFELYGRKFNYVDHGISVMNNGQYYSKKDRGWYKEDHPELLSVEDPHNRDIDVGSASFNIKAVKQAIDEAYQKWLDCDNVNNYLSQIISIPYELLQFREDIKMSYDSNKSDNRKVRTSPKRMKDSYQSQIQSAPMKIDMNDFPDLSSTIAPSKHHSRQIKQKQLLQQHQLQQLQLQQQLDKYDNANQNGSKSTLRKRQMSKNRKHIPPTRRESKPTKETRSEVACSRNLLSVDKVETEMKAGSTTSLRKQSNGVKANTIIKQNERDPKQQNIKRKGKIEQTVYKTTKKDHKQSNTHSVGLANQS